MKYKNDSARNQTDIHVFIYYDKTMNHAVTLVINIEIQYMYYVNLI